jgi:hypothetical protein
MPTWVLADDEADDRDLMAIPASLRDMTTQLPADQYTPTRRSTSTAGWPSADVGDEHRFLVNRPSRTPPELHTGARLPWQAA